KTICVSPWVAMPRTMARVVCTLWVTIDPLAPTNWFRSVDFPALGAPISATKPERVEAAAFSSFMAVIRPRLLASEPSGGGGLLRLAFGSPFGNGRLQAAHRHADGEDGIVIGSAAIVHRIDRRCGMCLVRPFLQGRLGVTA